MILDMTKDNPTSVMIKFTLPLMIGNLFQQLYNVVDTIVVGRYLGKNPLAAVGSSFMLMNFFSFIIIGLCMGASIVYSYYFGEKNYGDLKKSIYMSFVSIGIFSLVISIVLYFNTERLLLMINTPSEILAYSKDYLSIIFGGLVFVFFFNIGSGILRSIGNSRTPLVFLVLSAIINIVLDLVFVIKFNMNVEGVAYATVIAQGVSSVLCIMYALLKVPIIRMTKDDMVFERKILNKIAAYSIMTSLQQSIMTFGMLCVQGIVNTFGPDTIAAFSSGGKIDSIAYLPAQDFGNGFATYVAQNKGAKKDERIRQGVKSVVKCIAAFCLVMSLLVYTNSFRLMTIFIDPAEVEVINIGMEYLKVVAPFYLLIGFLFMFYGYFRGMGELHISLILTIGSLGTRVLIAYLLSKLWGRLGIWMAIPIGWALADLMGVYFYRMVNKKPST